MNSNLLFALFMNVLSAVYFAHEHAKMNESIVFASIKDYKYARLIQYEDFDHKHRLFNISAEIDGSVNKFLAKVYFSLIVDNDAYDLDMVLNNDLLSRSYGITIYSKFGKQTNNNSQVGKTCSYYQGSIRDTKNSKVFVSMCRRFRAIIILSSGVFIVEPLDNTNMYLIYKSEVPNFDEYFCPEFTYSLNDSFHFGSKQTSVKPQLRKQSTDSDNEFAYVRLVLIASKSTCEALFGDHDDIEDYLKSVVNIVDGYYQEMSVHVVLVHIELWLDRDYFQAGSTVTETMNNFLAYRLSQIRQDPDSYWNTAAAIHVIYNMQLSTSNVSLVTGIATLDEICTTSASGISRYQTNPALTATTLTHELGHNFGLVHVNDGNPKWNCPCPDGECIMNAVTYFSLKRVWSKCSLNFIRNRFALGAYDCLSDIPDPSSLVLGSGCGNTIVEAGEQCDCGFKANCKSKCCNPETCQFVPKATCDTGSCCISCQLLDEGVICREKSGECDLPDVCSGTSPHCPKNIYKEDGTSCLDGQAYCFEGGCFNRDILCQRVLGPGFSAPDFCYEVNRLGRIGGNCGLDPNSETGFKACAENDTFCGKLLCFGSDIVFGRSIFALVWNETNCISFGEILNNRPQAYGLVPDGTACGPSMSCQNHECQRIVASKCNPPCNEGFCDNFGHCRCKNGKLCDRSSVNDMHGLQGKVSLEFSALEIFIIFATNMFVTFIVIGGLSVFVKFCDGK